MAHLKNSKIAKLGAKASVFVAKQGLSLGLKTIGFATGPIGWVLSFAGKKFIENKVAPHAEALAIKALWRQEMRLYKKAWRKLAKDELKDTSVKTFKEIRAKLHEEKNIK